jgi:hypothetical protein
LDDLLETIHHTPKRIIVGLDRLNQIPLLIHLPSNQFTRITSDKSERIIIKRSHKFRWLQTDSVTFKGKVSYWFNIHHEFLPRNPLRAIRKLAHAPEMFRGFSHDHYRIAVGK